MKKAANTQHPATNHPTTNLKSQSVDPKQLALCRAGDQAQPSGSGFHAAVPFPETNTDRAQAGSACVVLIFRRERCVNVEKEKEKKKEKERKKKRKKKEKTNKIT